jgi:protein-arginine kinase activator protein McsA
VAKEYFIVKKSRYSIENMTLKKVIRVCDFEEAAVFRSGG